MTVIHIGDRTNPDPKIHVLYVYLSQSPFFPYFYRKASGLADSHFICFTVRANEQLNHYCMMLWDERYRSPTEPARGRFPILKKIKPESGKKSARGNLPARNELPRKSRKRPNDEEQIWPAIDSSMVNRTTLFFGPSSASRGDITRQQKCSELNILEILGDGWWRRKRLMTDKGINEGKTSVLFYIVYPTQSDCNCNYWWLDD